MPPSVPARVVPVTSVLVVSGKVQDPLFESHWHAWALWKPHRESRFEPWSATLEAYQVWGGL